MAGLAGHEGLILERRYARIGLSLKILVTRSEKWRIGCFLRSIFWMLGRAGYYQKAIILGFSDADVRCVLLVTRFLFKLRSVDLLSHCDVITSVPSLFIFNSSVQI